jgi:hypothetical protein
MATKGRGGDSLLVHMTPEEVQSLQALALKGGGTLTINPDTGLPEANFLKKMLPMIAGFALGPAGFGLMSAGMAGAAVGGITALSTGSLSRGLMAGLGAYGGASLGSSLMGASAGTPAANAAALGVEGAATGIGSQAAMLAEQTAGFGAEGLSSLADSARVAAGAAPSKAGMLSAGFDAVTKSPETLGKFAKSNFGALAAAASPMMAADTVQTTTKRPDTGTIRNFTFDPYGQTYSDAGSYPASEYKGMAQGGIVALAKGGVSDAEIQNWMASNQGADDKTIANAMQQYGVSAGQLSSAMGYNPTEVAQRYAAATAPPPAPTGSAAAQWAAANNIDINKQISDWALANPNATDALIDQQMLQYGISNEDVGRALGSSGGSRAMEWNTLAGNQGLFGLNQNINNWIEQNPTATRGEALAAMRNSELNEADIFRATGKTLKDLFTGPLEKVTFLPAGVGGGGKTTVNENGTITTAPNIPGRPDGGFTGMGQVRDAYTAGGGSLGYVNRAPISMAEFNERFNRQTGDSLAAYKYLMGRGEDGVAPVNPATQQRVGEIARPYSEAIRGIPAAEGRPNQKYIYQDGRYVENPNYVPVTYNTKGERVTGISEKEVLKGFDTLKPAQTQANFDYVTYLKANPDVQSAIDQGSADFGNKNDLAAAAYNHYNRYGRDEGREFVATATAMPEDKAVFEWADENNVSDAQLARRMGVSVAEVERRRKKIKEPANVLSAIDPNTAYGGANGGLMGMAAGGYAVGGGLGALAGGGSTSQYNLGGYSDGGRLLRGPGDGVSDSIPATIGNKQPARLADGEFVIPARIVSELGNGSTEAGARKLYAMMDRVQKARGKTTGKNRVAANTRSDKYLPA